MYTGLHDTSYNGRTASGDGHTIAFADLHCYLWSKIVRGREREREGGRKGGRTELI